MTDTAAARRVPGHPIAELFHARWSPRAFTDEEIPETTLMGLFEAARWAPSGGNVQPWRFAWARRGTEAFERFLSALVPANQLWASKAAALIGVASVTTMRVRGKEEPVPMRSHAFDAGAAWAQLALQAHLWGWSAHAMAGFDPARGREALSVPEGHELQVFVAVGRRGDPASLPEALRAREAPSDRKALAELVREGSLGP